MGLGELTEQHGDELTPATESFCVSFGFVFADDVSEIAAIEKSKYLAEDAGTI